MSAGRDYLGTFRLIRLVRAGQTCQIWEAVRDGDNERVALKALQPELRDNKEEINYLKHEFEVGQCLKHPRVIQIYDFNIDRRLAFLVMEYNAGKNMKLVLRSGPERVAYLAPQIIEQAAQGLGHLHEKGWVHRDVKPDNFLVSDEGDVKLIDFALAYRIRTGLGKLFGGRSKVQGTRSYMAPEQIRGKAVDARADIYSFGCVLYELLSGKPPFTGVSPEDLLNKHLYAAIPSVIAANNNVTPEFGDLIAKLMAKQPADRLKSMGEFLAMFRATRIFRVRPKAPEDIEAN